MYLVMILKEAVVVESFGITRDVPMSWADGMIGAAPVFTTREEAEAYAGDKEILEVSVP